MISRKDRTSTFLFLVFEVLIIQSATTLLLFSFNLSCSTFSLARCPLMSSCVQQTLSCQRIRLPNLHMRFPLGLFTPYRYSQQVINCPPQNTKYVPLGTHENPATDRTRKTSAHMYNHESTRHRRPAARHHRFRRGQDATGISYIILAARF